MNFISLFSGIGGFDLAFNHTGMIGAGMCEIDKSCQNKLHEHFPDVPLFNDVKQIGVATHDKGSIDLVCGGFPCQDLSVAGKRKGLAGERSGLWFEFARVIDELEPRWVVVENVPGLLSSNKGRDFAVIVRWLAERGYGVCWRILDAQYFGLAQRRKRVFIVASLGSGRSAEVLFEREGMSRDTPPRREAGKEVAYSLRTYPAKGGKSDGGIDENLLARESGQGYWMQDTVSGTLDENMGKSGHASRPAIIGTLAASGAGLNRPAGQGNKLDFIVPSLVSNGDAHSGFRDENGIVATSGVRRLTPTECERLQGFPDGWTEGQSDSVRYKQLGNAVAVPVVEWIGKRIIQAEK